MRKILAALAAGSVLVASAFIVTAITPSGAIAQTSDESTTTEEAHPKATLLDTVLEELVADGVITENQAVAIQERLAVKVEERRARRDQIRSFLDDGVIDADELSQLPEGHPFLDPDGPFAPYLDDGQLTIDELREVKGAFGHRGRHHRGEGRGFGPKTSGAGFGAATEPVDA